MYFLHSTEFSFGILERNRTKYGDERIIPENSDINAANVSVWQTIDTRADNDSKNEMIDDEDLLPTGKKLSRKKRYLAFPLGSSFSV